MKYSSRLCNNLRMTMLDEEQNPSSSPVLEASPALVQALRRLLRPLVKLLLAKHITYPYFITLLKALYVDVAANDLPLAGKRQTDSRLSLMTGVHRKDVHRLLNEPELNAAAPTHVSLGARLIARWNGDSAYLDDSARPKPLPRLARADGSASFEQLVNEASKDIRPRAVLDEWLRLGLVEIDAEDQVVLTQGAFVPRHGVDEKLYFLGRNVRDHLETAVHNVLDEQPARLERSVYSDGLSPAAVAELAAMAEGMGMDALRALNQRARELRTQAAEVRKDEATNAALANEAKTYRMTFGVYFYSNVPGERAETQHGQ